MPVSNMLSRGDVGWVWRNRTNNWTLTQLYIRLIGQQFQSMKWLSHQVVFLIQNEELLIFEGAHQSQSPHSIKGSRLILFGALSLLWSSFMYGEMSAGAAGLYSPIFAHINKNNWRRSATSGFHLIKVSLHGIAIWWHITQWGSRKVLPMVGYVCHG